MLTVVRVRRNPRFLKFGWIVGDVKLKNVSFKSLMFGPQYYTNIGLRESVDIYI